MTEIIWNSSALNKDLKRADEWGLKQIKCVFDEKLDDVNQLMIPPKQLVGQVAFFLEFAKWLFNISLIASAWFSLRYFQRKQLMRPWHLLKLSLSVTLSLSKCDLWHTCNLFY